MAKEQPPGPWTDDQHGSAGLPQSWESSKPWGRKEESTSFWPRKEHAVDGPCAAAGHEASGGVVSLIRQLGTPSVRPRFCHNAQCDMFGRPNYVALGRMLCLSPHCGQKLFRQEPSNPWLRLTDPESGPAAHTGAFKKKLALPAPKAGIGFGAGRKVNWSF
jgi:hypothetical protein